MENKGNVLIVDDDSFCLNLYLSFLELLGFVVTDFSDPRQALDFMSKTEKTFCLLVTDFNMPRINGAKLIAAIKKQQPDIRTICLTGTPDAEKECLEVGCDCFFVKPVNLQCLKWEIEKLVV